MDPQWVKVIKFKAEKIIQSIKAYWGESFVYSDTDVQFFSPTEPFVLEALECYDIVCHLSRPDGELCTGFFALKANGRTLALWESVYEAIDKEKRDQKAFNRIIRSMNGIKYGHFPRAFFGGGTFSKTRWQPGDPLFIPPNPVMHHANCTVGLNNKILQLDLVKNMVIKSSRALAADDLN